MVPIRVTWRIVNLPNFRRQNLPLLGLLQTMVDNSDAGNDGDTNTDTTTEVVYHYYHIHYELTISEAESASTFSPPSLYVST